LSLADIDLNSVDVTTTGGTLEIRVPDLFQLAAGPASWSSAIGGTLFAPLGLRPSGLPGLWHREAFET
jgi:hypothetical protein